MNNYTFTIENQGEFVNLVYSLQASDDIDSLCLGMITNNNIKGVARTVFTQMDAEKYLKYDVSAKVSANQMFKERVNKKKLLFMLSSIVDTIMLTEEYMIDEKLILLDLEYIFVDPLTYDTDLIVLPIINVNRKHYELKTFVKDIVVNGQFDYTENLDYVAKIINFLNGSSNFSLVAFKKLLNESKTEGKKSGKTSPTSPKSKKLERIDKKDKPVIPVKPDIREEKEEVSTDEKPISLFYLLQHYNKENAALYKAQKERKKNAAQKERTREDDLDILFGSKKNSGEKENDIRFAIPGQERYIEEAPKSYPAFEVEKEIVSGGSIDIPRGEEMDFGDTVYEEEEVTEETELLEDEELGDDYLNFPYLIAKASGEKVIINKPFFKIGRKQEYADFCIRKSTISDKHAYIVKREDGFYIVDTKSKNHTYLNDMKIQDNAEIKLEHGIEIRFAKEIYEFRMY